MRSWLLKSYCWLECMFLTGTLHGQSFACACRPLTNCRAVPKVDNLQAARCFSVFRAVGKWRWTSYLCNWALNSWDRIHISFQSFSLCSVTHVFLKRVSHNTELFDACQSFLFTNVIHFSSSSSFFNRRWNVAIASLGFEQSYNF